MEFYRDSLGGEITGVMYYKDLPEEARKDDPGEMSPEAILHATYKLADTTIMASDNEKVTAGDNIALTWSHEDSEEVMRVWQAFVDAGSMVSVPINKSFFAPLFGSLIDPYGISWQIMQWVPL